MAKGKQQKKKRNKQYRPKYVTGGRVDYSKGGRVSLAHGGMPEPPIRDDYPSEQAFERAIARYQQKLALWEKEHDSVGGGNSGGGGGGGNDDNQETTTPYVPVKGAVDPNRTERVQATGQQAERIAAGDFTGIDLPTIPDAQKINQEGTTLDPASEAFKMQQTQAATAAGVEGVSTEQVKTGTAQTAGETTQVQIGTDSEGNPIYSSPGVAAQITQDELTTVSDKDVTVDAAKGEVTRGAEVAPQQTLTDVRDFANVDAVEAEVAKAKTIDAALSAGAFAPDVTGTTQNISPTAEAERQTRESIVDDKAVGRQAAEIIGTAGYEAAQQRTVKGTAAKGAAAEMVAVTANIPQDVAAAIVEDPATVEAQIDTQPVEVQAAVAALPTEALVSSQMESLLGGMEDGKIPLWAKPAVDIVNSKMAQRGLNVSTVGRDALFNAIIQSAMPMAQSNAQALQSRAAQNLTNEQQANLQQATQEQQLRMQNLANRQDAVSQTAQMSQQMRTMQSQFRQQAVMTTAQQQQQTMMQNLQNQQQAAVLNAQNQQAINSQNLGNEQQINLAELQVEAQAAGADQSSENQRRLAEMQVAADFMARNATFKQDMDKANLSEETKIRLANLTALNQAEAQQLTTAQQTELANLNARMNLNIKNAELAQQMGVAQLSVDQQTAMQRATVQANMDMAKFSTAQQVELANSKFMQTVTIENMNTEQQAIMQEATALAQLDIQNLGVRERLQVEHAKNFLAMDMDNLNNEQQVNMLKAQQEQQQMQQAQQPQQAQVTDPAGNPAGGMAANTVMNRSTGASQ